MSLFSSGHADFHLRNFFSEACLKHCGFLMMKADFQCVEGSARRLTFWFSGFPFLIGAYGTAVENRSLFTSLLALRSKGRNTCWSLNREMIGHSFIMNSALFHVPAFF